MGQQNAQRGLRQVEQLSKLMDSQFHIPGTSIQFGLDGIIGLIPGIGDLSTFAVSAYMVLIMARNGASGYVLARMVLNVLIDAAIGSIPFVGDIFDFAFKANTMNVRLMRQHFKEGRHRGSAWKVIIPVLLALAVVLGLIIWGLYNLIAKFF